MILSDFYIDVKKIFIAHEFTLDSVRKCEYPNGRGSYGLVYPLEGEAEYRFSDGACITVKKGDCLLIFPESAYVIETNQFFRHYTVNFEIHQESSALESFSSFPCFLQSNDTEQLELTLKRLVSLWNGKQAGYEMQAVGLLYESLALFYTSYAKAIGRKESRLLIAREYMEQHFNQPISLEDLARLSSMSVTNFRREWAKQYAEPPMQYRDSIRLYYAKEYLSCGYYSVSEVAKKCGFEDVSYFVRFFKKKVGVTPGAF